MGCFRGAAQGYYGGYQIDDDEVVDDYDDDRHYDLDAASDCIDGDGYYDSDDYEITMSMKSSDTVSSLYTSALIAPILYFLQVTFYNILTCNLDIECQ